MFTNETPHYKTALKFPYTPQALLWYLRDRNQLIT